MFQKSKKCSKIVETDEKDVGRSLDLKLSKFGHLEDHRKYHVSLTQSEVGN